jgi:chromosome segregation ATPase
MTDRVRTYPELIAELKEEIDLWRMQYERIAKHVTYYKDMWTARHSEIADYKDVVMCLEAQIADQDNEIDRLKRLAEVQQGTVEFLNQLAHIRAVKLDELEGKTDPDWEKSIH